MNNKLYDLSQLESIAAGNGDFIKKMINLFLHQTPVLVSRIYEGFTTENWAEVKSAAHQMKPSIDMMGIKSLHAVVRGIELNAKTESNLDQIPEMYTTLAETLENVFEELRSI